MPLRPSLLAVLVTVIWGMNFVVIHGGLDQMPPLLFVAIRFVVVIFPAILFVPRPAARWRDILLLGALLSLGQFALLYAALSVGMPPGLASLVAQAQVVFTALFAFLALREVPSRVQLLGVAVGVAGLVVVATGRSESTSLVALLISLASAASWGAGNVVARRLGPSTRPGTPPWMAGVSMTVWSALVVPVPAAGMALVFDGLDAVMAALTHLTLVQVLSTLYTAWLASLVGYGIWNTLLGRYPASAVAPFSMLVPPIGIACAWLVLGETPNAAELAGGALLLLGVATASGALRLRGRPRDLRDLRDLRGRRGLPGLPGLRGRPGEGDLPG